MAEPLSLAYIKIIEYALLCVRAGGKKSIMELPEKSLVWKFPSQIDGSGWVFAIHGNPEPRNIKPEGCMEVENLGGAKAAVWWNGWYAGEITMSGGWFVAGVGANEDQLISDLEKEILFLNNNPEIN